jgi:diguanylate cyclase (GGDEF)-like protein
MRSEQPVLEMTRRVLVIDDAPTSRAMVRAQLAPEAIELREASDGERGLEAARAWKPDLILLDLTLPGWDGFETLRRLKDDPVTTSIPVIFLSGHTDTAEKAMGLDLGAVDFVSKPCDATELRARVRAALRTKYLQDLLEQRAHLDGLTGLANRHALEARLASEFALCPRRRSPLVVLLADLDDFKTVNDTYGHPAGDEVLRCTARALRSSVRAGDFVARYGGEEFIVVAPDCDLLGGIVIAERFRARVERLEVPIYRSRIHTTASLGVAATTDFASIDPAELLERADRAVYAAKSRGRNRICTWDNDRQIPLPASPEALSLATVDVARPEPGWAD